ncbi:hypothetical protein GGI08_007291, partial [Coemansia sp. S2]
SAQLLDRCYSAIQRAKAAATLYDEWAAYGHPPTSHRPFCRSHAHVQCRGGGSKVLGVVARSMSAQGHTLHPASKFPSAQLRPCTTASRESSSSELGALHSGVLQVETAQLCSERAEKVRPVCHSQATGTERTVYQATLFVRATACTGHTSLGVVLTSPSGGGIRPNSGVAK